MIETELEQESALLLAMELMSRESITPNDDGCQDYLAERLAQSGFNIEKMKFGDVSNLYARIGTKSPLLVFAGHTDVVPPGPLEEWTTHPFQPETREGYLYGRGATDMKAAIACMISATEKYLSKNPDFDGSIAFLLTSDEEGDAINGTQKVVQELQKRNERIDYCLVGEASSEKNVGDQIRIGRRGSLHGRLIVHGKQGHVAFPHLAKNALHMALMPLLELTQTVWDKGDQHFPPTTFQISNVKSGTGAANVIPGKAEVLFNFRYSPASNVTDLKDQVEDIFNKSQLNFDIDWNNSAEPFISKEGELRQAVDNAILDVASIKTKHTTGGGTSDARFIAPTGAEIVELGFPNTYAHQINERVKVIDLEVLTKCYERILEKLF